MNYNINITNARKDLYKLTDMVIEDGAIVNISTKTGSAVLISAKDYNALIETLYLSQNVSVKKSIVEGLKEPLDECIPLKDIKW